MGRWTTSFWATIIRAPLLNNGDVRCWGNSNNSAGQLGLGHTTPVADPSSEPAINLGASVIMGSTGEDDFSCAVLDGYKVLCWGDGAYGKLGRGNTEADIGDNEDPADWGSITLF